MKVFIVLASFIALASAGHLHQLAGRAAITTGTSTQFRSEDNYGNYNYGFDIESADGGSSRREEEINGVRRGMYSLRDADGRQRTVHYVADASGFHADIQTNEPGVEAKDPADVVINRAQGAAPIALAAPAAPVAFAAPAPVAAPLPAPAAFAAPARFAVKGAFDNYAPRQAYAAPAPIAVAAPEVIEAPTPRAFSYSFGSTHAAPAYAAPAYAAPAPIAAPAPVLAAPAPVFQQRLEY